MAEKVCVECDGQINPERLKVLPDTSLCIGCARQSESKVLAKPRFVSYSLSPVTNQGGRKW
jgi:RNA polymerase-binding transcription factor DksA